MNLDLIRNFLTVAKTKNITHTAQALYVAQSTVSQRLKLLEDELGCQLVSRSRGGKSAELTQDGLAFLPLAERWMELCQETENFHRGQTKQHLTVGCVHSLAACLLQCFFTDLIDRYPNIHFHIKLLDSEEIYARLEKRKIDVGIVLQNLHKATVCIRPLLSEKMVCLGGRDYIVPNSPIDPKDLDQKQEIHLNWGMEFALWHDYWFQGCGSPKVEVNSIFLVAGAMEKGSGWAVVPESARQFLAKQGLGKLIPLENLPPNRISYVIEPAAPSPDLLPLLEMFNSEIDSYIQNL